MNHPPSTSTTPALWHRHPANASATSKTPRDPLWLQASLLLIVATLFAMIQIPWARYQLGVGNQGIQIAYLLQLHNPALFAKDITIVNTLSPDTYPSFFFQLCAPLLSIVSLPTLYLTLHILTTIGVFAVVMGLALAMTRDRWVALAAGIFLLAGHHQALAGETLYSQGFTHTWAIFPLSLLALLLFFRERFAMAFLLVGLLFNFHALEAGHLVFIMGFAALCDIRRIGFNQLGVSASLFLIAAVPTLLKMVQLHQTFDAQWLQLMHIRSADHSFPSAWWRAEMPDVPRFCCIIGLAALAMGFRLPPRTRRKIMTLSAGIAILFAAGWLFTDLYPIPLVIRAQFFRASRLLMILAFVVIAHGCVAAWRLPWHRHSQAGEIPAWRAWLEFASACFTALCIAFPPLIQALPLALFATLPIALINARLAWWEALLAGTMSLVCVAAFLTIHFVIPGFTAGLTLRDLLVLQHAPNILGFALLFIATLVGLIWAQFRAAAPQRFAAAIGALLCAAALFITIPTLYKTSQPDPAWADLQLHTRALTPVDAVILTPAGESMSPGESGFRILSQRSIVGEWRDGTQLYFNAAFKDDWWNRMNDLQPGLVRDATSMALMSGGKPLDDLSDDEILTIARKYGADYVVLRRNTQRALISKYSNDAWTLYATKIDDGGMLGGDAALKEDDQFIQGTVFSNIEKYRKSDVELTLADAAGKPLSGVAFTATQTSSPFGFGASMPFFKPPAFDPKPDFKPGIVSAAAQKEFLQAFNYSVIPFSSDWRFLEPAEGHADYADLDAYVNWCAQNHVRPEFHFASGFMPAWIRNHIGPSLTVGLTSHLQTLAKRYGKQVTDWQITSGEVNPSLAQTLFDTMRQQLPDARLGIEEDTRFWSAQPGGIGQDDMLRGLQQLRDLKKAGVRVDYFAIRADRPLGVWAPAKQIYAVLDTVAKEGVRIHITDFGIAVGDPVTGEKVKNPVWTADMQASYYERFFAICFSHPAVDAINVMGLTPDTWLPGEGLLDGNDRPTPAFNKLKELITTRWRTSLSDKTARDGTISFRGFHGMYDLTVALPNGKTATATFKVQPDTPNKFHFKLDAAKGTLVNDP